ncbi:hypothetical protein [Microbulbifer epialgicus]|uniref:Uncharacterized protein n=1 Tax=Microbulbifer epialgicus TaxID=393907 RepID=A0ABV4NV01_9GAMM
MEEQDLFIDEPVIHKLRIGERCQHNKFLLDESLESVICGICDTPLDPMWVIQQFANAEHRLFMRMKSLEEIARKAEAKNRCKCEHCNKMTRIQRR